MAKRVLPLLMALVVAAAPVALEACQIACGLASTRPGTAHAVHQESAARPSAHGHSCHQAVTSRAQLSPESHACGHPGDLPGVSAIGVARTVDHAVVLAGVVTPGASSPQLHSGATAAAVRFSASPDRGDVRLAVPLRI